MNGISKLLSTDGFIQVNKTLIKKLGLHEAIIIGELCAEYNYWEEHNKLVDDMFFSTRDNIEENTGLNDHYQRKAITTLKEKGILSVSKQDVPAKNYYKIHFDKLLSLLSSSSSRDEELEVHEMHLNNNKQTKQTNNKVLSKDNTTDFTFGKTKPKKQSLYTKCVSLIDQKTNNKQTRHLLIEWLNMLLEKYKDRGRTLYANVFKGKLNMLDKYDEKDWNEIIQYNLQKGYEGFYPIPNYQQNTQDVRKGKAWEEGLSCDTYTEEEKRQIEKEREEMIARGERVWY